MRMDIENAIVASSNICNVDSMIKLLNAIKVFQEETPFNECIIMRMDDDSITDNGRIDIELLFRNIDYSTNTITGQLWQKVFYINGEILDCITYGNRYIKA